MVIDIAFRHMNHKTPKDSVRTYVQEKSEKLKKYFSGKMHLTWTLEQTTGKDTEEEMAVHCHLVGNHMDYFAEATAHDLLSCIDQVISKLDRQTRKKKEVVKGNLHRKAG